MKKKAANFILVYSKEACTSKPEVSIWRRISKWLFLKLMLLSNYRANCWYQNRFSSWYPMDHSQQAASSRALSHDTSFLVSKFCTYTRYSELFCHRHLTICFSTRTLYTFKAFIPNPPQSPFHPFFLLFVWTWLIVVEKEGIVTICFRYLALSLSVRSTDTVL